MKVGLIVVALALVASPLAGQRDIHFRAGVNVPAEVLPGLMDGTFAGAVYLDIPRDSEPVEEAIHVRIEAFRVGLLWAKHDAYIHIPAMMLFGEQAFLAVGGAPGFNDLSLTFSLIAGVGFTVTVPGRPGISWGAEALYLHDLTSRRPSGLSAGHVVFTAGIGFRP